MIAPTHNKKFRQDRIRSGTRQLLWLTAALSCLLIAAQGDTTLKSYLVKVEEPDFSKAVDAMQGAARFDRGTGSDWLFKRCAESPAAAAGMTEKELKALEARSRDQKIWKSLSDAEGEKIAKIKQFQESLGTKLAPTITTDETLSLMLYTENKIELYGVLNWLCRTGQYKNTGTDEEKKFRQLAPYLKLAIKALEKLPTCGHDVLFRGLGIPRKWAKFEDTAMQFTSTSRELKGCYMNYGANANTLVIYLGFGSFAKDISSISLYPSESECLISPLQETIPDPERDIDLSGVNAGDYVEIDGICFIRAPLYFSWTDHNTKVHAAFRSAVLSGEPLARAVRKLTNHIKMNSTGKIVGEKILARLRKRRQEIEEAQSDTSSTISISESEMSV